MPMKKNPKPQSLNRYLADRGQIITITLLAIIAIAIIAPNLPAQTVYSFVIPLITGFVILITGSVVIGYFNKVIGQRPVIKSSKPNLETTTKFYGQPQDIFSITPEEKRLFVDIPNVDFDFADKTKIKNFYFSYFKEKFKVEQIISEKVTESGGEAKGQIPSVLESKISDKDQSKLTSTFKPYELSTEEMFLNYQRETVQKGQVTLGLEKVDVDLSDLISFNNLIADLKTRFNFEVDNTQLENTRVLLKKRAAEKTMVRLEDSDGYVLMQGKFKILEVDNNLYKLIYDHPVNEYIAAESNRVAISVVVNKDAIESSAAGNYAQAIGSSITIKVYGNVWKNVSRKENSWELQITPIAIYR